MRRVGGNIRVPRLNEVEEWSGKEEQGDGPYPQCGTEAIGVEQPLHDQRQDNAGETSASPHDAIGEALAFVEPFVDEHDARGVGETSSDSIDHALGDDQVGGVGGEGAQAESQAHGDQSTRG